MYQSFHYYVLDDISETVLTHFYANNDRMAKKILEGFDFKKAHLDREDVSILCDDCPVVVYETYLEVTNAEHHRYCNFYAMPLSELESAK